MTPVRCLVALSMIAVAGVAGCSHDPEGGGMMTRPSSPSASAAVSADDVRFMRAMVPMERQAVRMSLMAGNAGAGRQTQALARRIRASQRDQLRSVATCLDGWRGGDGGGMPMGQGSPRSTLGPGMMSEARMGRLSRMHGRSFDAHFLAMMIVHHRAAVAADDREVAHGSDPAARELARMMAGSQRAELDLMARMTGR
jgi:uncharacterized protein (DUF305 family)